MRPGLVIVTLIASLGCAGRTGPSPEPAAPTGPIAERDAVHTDDPCAHYLADAPPPRGGDFMPVSDEDVAAAIALVNQEVQPRCAHYHFAHNAMIIMLFEDSAFSRALWNHEDPLPQLDAIAEGVNEICAEDDPSGWQMPSPGFRLGRTELLDRPVIIVDVLATPTGPTEAHLFAVVGRPWPEGVEHRMWTGLDRYFVLEHSFSHEPTHTVMGGWTRANGVNTHLNFGAGPMPTPTAFLHVIGQNLCADFTAARTTIPD